MRLANWVASDPPSDEIKAGLVQLAELVSLNDEDQPEAGVDVYVHASGKFAMTCFNGSEWYICYVDKRQGPRRAQDLSPAYDLGTRGRREGERRTLGPDTEKLFAFIRQYGNGDA